MDIGRHWPVHGTGRGDLQCGLGQLLAVGGLMEALRETTGGQFPAHTYLLDGTTLVAYIKVSETKPFYFKNGIKHFDKRGRTFAKADVKQFG